MWTSKIHQRKSMRYTYVWWTDGKFQLLEKNVTLKDQKSWVEHSPNIMVARCCLDFIKNECRRGLIDFEATFNYENSLKPKHLEHSNHAQPRCNHERSRLFELFQTMHEHEANVRLLGYHRQHDVLEERQGVLTAGSHRSGAATRTQTLHPGRSRRSIGLVL